ncbi:MAG: ATP-binding protein [Candidatus Margulisiibacteriota bacterium]|jgi:PAS domain S-box-containing protein
MALILLIISLICTLLFSVFIFSQIKQNRIYIFLGFAILSAALWQVCILFTSFEINIAFFYSLTFIGPIFIPWFIFVFINNYPSNLYKVKIWQYLALLLPGIALTYIIIFKHSFFIINNDLVNESIARGPAYYLFVGYITVSFLLLILLLIRNLFITKGIVKLQTKYLLLALVITFLIGATFNLFIPAFFNGNVHFNKLGPSSMIFFIIILGYFFAKHRFFGFQFLIRKSIVYLALTSSIFAFFAFFVLWMGNKLELLFNIDRIVIAIIASIIIALFYPSLKRFIDLITENIFLKYHYNYQFALKKFSQNLSLLIKLDNINALLINSFSETLKIKEIAIFYLDKYENYLLKEAYNYSSEVNKIKGNSLLLDFFNRVPEILVQEEFRYKINKIKDNKEKIKFMALKEELKQLNTEIVVPLLNGSQVFGIIVFGKKLSDDFYTKEDVNYIETALNQANIAIQNALHYEELQENIQILSELNEFTKKINKSLNPDDIISELSNFLGRFFSLKKNQFIFVEKETKDYFMTDITNGTSQLFDMKLLDFRKMRRGNFFNRNYFLLSEVKDVIPIEDFEKLNDFFKSYYFSHDVLFMHLANGEEIIGCVCSEVNHEAKLIIDKQGHILNTIVNEVGAAWQNAALYHEILESKNFSEEILQNMTTGVITVDKDLNIMMFNNQAEKILGLKIKEVKHKPINSLCSISDRFSLFERSWLQKKSFQYETCIKIADKEIPVAISTDILRDLEKNEIGVIGVIADLSAIKILQKQVEQANRLSSLGTMAASIAHEIKNPLVAIKAFSELLEKMWQDANFRQKYSEIVHPQIDRINNLCQALLKLGKPQKIELIELELKKVFLEVLTLLEGERKFYRAEFITNISDNLFLIGDYSQITQVLLNLLINALQALPKNQGGVIEIKAALQKDIGYVLLSIKDSGIGIPKQRLNNIFDPFYTTKAEGTGLGLSIVYKIIEEHHGKIFVESELNNGTVFYIYLPTKFADLEKLTEKLTNYEKI